MRDERMEDVEAHMADMRRKSSFYTIPRLSLSCAVMVDALVEQKGKEEGTGGRKSGTGLTTEPQEEGAAAATASAPGGLQGAGSVPWFEEHFEWRQQLRSLLQEGEAPALSVSLFSNNGDGGRRDSLGNLSGVSSSAKPGAGGLDEVTGGVA